MPNPVKQRWVDVLAIQQCNSKKLKLHLSIWLGKPKGKFYELAIVKLTFQNSTHINIISRVCRNCSIVFLFICINILFLDKSFKIWSFKSFFFSYHEIEFEGLKNQNVVLFFLKHVLTVMFESWILGLVGCCC